MQKIILLFAFALSFSCCSKKTSDVAISSKEKMDESFRKSAPVPGPAPKINIGKAETFILDNGLQVIVVENHKIPKISFQISLKNDPIIEGDKVGYTSMAGQILNRGTSTKTKAEIDAAVDFIGASLSSSSDGIFASSLTKHSEKILDLMADVLYNPSFPEDELDKIKKQTLSGLEDVKSNPDAIAANMRSKILYGEGHPYGEIQTVNHVNNISLADLKSYYSKFFIPNNAYLVIVGDISLSKARDISEKYFGKWEKKAFKPVKNKQVEFPTDRQVHFANKDGSVQSIINIVYPVDLYPGAADVIKVNIMNTILGSGTSSRLTLNIREDKGYTYDARSSISSDPLVGRFIAQSNVRNEVTDSTITEFLYEMKKIVNEPVSKEELQTTKNYMTGVFALTLESPETVARFALNRIKYNLPEDYYETYLQRLNAVTVEDISAMAKKYIRPEIAQVLVTGNKDEVSEKLLAFDSNGELDYYSPFAEKIDYSAIAIPEGVTAESVISDYLNAIGGSERVKALKSIHLSMSANLMGQAITMEQFIQSPDKFAMVVGNGQMVFQEQIFDGEKALSAGMGQKQIMTEGDTYEELKENAVIIPQQFYGKEYSIELKGIEELDGNKCYKIAVTRSSGKTTYEFYDLNSGLLVQHLSTAQGPQGEVSIITRFSDYKEVSGIQYPHSIKISGMMPVDFEMKLEDIELNGAIDPERFLIN